MKKIISFFIIILILFCFGLTCCLVDLEKKSLIDYIAFINKNKIGESIYEIDHPDYFLPSLTFLQDYNYIEGDYFWREDDPLKLTGRPSISFLSLKYEEDVYFNAKQCMLENIKPYNDKFYTYDSYVFYENSNFISLKAERNFPQYFTMACYSDESYTLIFMGAYITTAHYNSKLEYWENIENNWKSFIDEYYGECYNFS